MDGVKKDCFAYYHLEVYIAEADITKTVTNCTALHKLYCKTGNYNFYKPKEDEHGPILRLKQENW